VTVEGKRSLKLSVTRVIERSKTMERRYLFRWSWLSAFVGGSFCRLEIDFRRGGESLRALQVFCKDGRLMNWLNTDVNQTWYKGVKKRHNKV
jgi:hypothetical protein